jgi:hypothetical protein
VDQFTIQLSSHPNTPTSRRLTSRGHAIAQRERATAWRIGGSRLRSECVLAGTVGGEVGCNWSNVAIGESFQITMHEPYSILKSSIKAGTYLHASRPNSTHCDTRSKPAAQIRFVTSFAAPILNPWAFFLAVFGLS